MFLMAIFELLDGIIVIILQYFLERFFFVGGEMKILLMLL